MVTSFQVEPTTHLGPPASGSRLLTAPSPAVTSVSLRHIHRYVSTSCHRLSRSLGLQAALLPSHRLSLPATCKSLDLLLSPLLRAHRICCTHTAESERASERACLTLPFFPADSHYSADLEFDAFVCTSQFGRLQAIEPFPFHPSWQPALSPALT